MNKNFTMDIATTVPASYLHFNLYICDTKILLEPLDQDERERLLEDWKNYDIWNYPNTEELPTENQTSFLITTFAVSIQSFSN